MRQPSIEIQQLREESMKMLSAIRDRDLLEDIVRMLREQYLDECVEFDADGKPISRRNFLGLMEKANDRIENGEYLTDEQVSEWIADRPIDG